MNNLFILGAGGHASVLVDILKQQNIAISGIFSPELDEKRQVFSGIPIYADEDLLQTYSRKSTLLINGIGSIPGNELRARLLQKFLKLGFSFSQVIASTATVSPYAQLGKGVQVLQGAIIQAGAVIGDHTIVNSGAIVEHDCIIGSNNHIAPGVTLSGQVKTEEYVHIGTGASVIQSITIGKNSIIGAGSTIAKNVGENIICFPAHITKKVIK